MSLTPTEEAQTRQLIAQEAPLLTLAASEATIISKLGATKVNLSQLPAATTVADADLLLIRQGATDKGVPASALKTYATSAASETVAGIVRLATDAEVAAATSRAIAVDPAGLAVSSQKSATITAVATGTADALVATFVPAIASVANQTILVRATAANATTTPTINPGSGAIVIVKGNNLPLVAGDIAGAGHWLEITLDVTLTKANLQNPATGIATVTTTSDATFADNSVKQSSTGWVRGAMSAIAIAAGFSTSFGANGYVKFPTWLGSLLVQWASQTVGNSTAITFPIAFPTTCYQVIIADGASTAYACAAGNLTTTGCVAWAKDNTGGYNTATARYIAIGK